MQVRYVGFKLVSNAINFSTQELYQHLHEISGKEVEGVSANRYFYFNNAAKDNYLVGLIVTLKDQKRFCRAEILRGDFTLKTDELGDDKLVDFNFFAVRKDTGKGVIQYYHNSCSPNIFGDSCKKIFYTQKDNLIAAKYDELSGGAERYTDAKSHRKAKAHYRGRPKFSILVDQRNIEVIIRAFKEVKNLTVTFEAPKAPTDAAVAANRLSETVSVRYKFGVSEQVENIAHAASQLLGRDGFIRGKAKGLNEFDEERSVDLLRSPQDFGQDDFDDVASEVNNFRASEFVHNNLLDSLIEILEEPQHGRVFATVDQDS